MTKDRLEKDVEDKFCRQLGYLGCKVKKFRVWGEKGPPDRIIFCPGAITCFVEFKRTKNEIPSPHQIAYIKELRNLGFKCLITHEWKVALDFVIKTMENKA